VLIIGADRLAERAARSVLEGLVMPCTVVGFVPLPHQEIRVTGSPVINLDVREIRETCGRVDEIIIAIPPARYGEIQAIVAKLEPLCVPVRAILDFGKGVVIREAIFDFQGIPMVDLRVTPSESVMYMIAKRGFDLVFSTLVLILFAPIMILIAIAIRLTSPGPTLFTQDRVGLNGRIFRIFKLRTMRMTNPAESDTHWTTPDDSRRTKLGTFLRWANLDELPQFFNVLKGDMSIVGPRPERPYFVQKFIQEVAQYNTRHYLKAGITGWAQVNGWRGDTSIARRVEHDLFYLRNWSLLFDLKIIFLTVWRTATANRNAY
jgi:Undecaprenyl-phosphate glucose phosphotransferase